MRRVLCLYPAWVIRGPRRALTLRTSTGRRGTTTHMRCLLYPRWCPKRRVSTWSFLKRSGLGKCKGRAGGPCNQCNDSLLIGVVFPALHPFLCATNDWCVCVCVCVTSQLLKLRSSSMTLDINQKLVSHCNLRSGYHPYQNLRPTHTQTNTIYIVHTIAHRISIWDAYSCPKKDVRASSWECLLAVPANLRIPMNYMLKMQGGLFSTLQIHGCFPPSQPDPASNIRIPCSCWSQVWTLNFLPLLNSHPELLQFQFENIENK